MIKLQRDNVVKVVQSEFKAKQLEAQGFKRVKTSDISETLVKDVSNTAKDAVGKGRKKQEGSE